MLEAHIREVVQVNTRQKAILKLAYWYFGAQM